jgi:hypothetical protein
VRVGIVVELGQLRPEGLLDQAEEMLEVVRVHAQSGRAHAQAFHEPVRTDRQRLDLERGRARQHAEALAERVKRLGGAELGLARQFAQQRGHAVVRVGHSDSDVFGRAGLAQQPSQRLFEPRDRALAELATAAAELAQRFEAAFLEIARARLLGETKQLLLELVQQRLESGLERVREQLEHDLECRARARRERQLRQGQRRDRGDAGTGVIRSHDLDFPLFRGHCSHGRRTRASGQRACQRKPASQLRPGVA